MVLLGFGLVVLVFFSDMLYSLTACILWFWCGVVWCGVVWCDVVWCGVVSVVKCCCDCCSYCTNPPPFQPKTLPHHPPH